RFDEVRARVLSQSAGRDLLLISQQRSLEDHLGKASGFVSYTYHTLDIPCHKRVVGRLERADIYHHVQFASAVEDCPSRFECLDVRRVGAQRKAYDRADLHSASTQSARSFANPDRIYADRGESVSSSFFAQLEYLVTSRIGFEESVIDVAGYLTGRFAFSAGEAESYAASCNDR